MNGPRMAEICLINVLLFFLTALFCSNTRGETLSSSLRMIHPQEVLITSFYHGETVTVRALIPPNHQVALRIIGPEEDLHLLEKGRVWGLWMNIRQVIFRHVPTVYLLQTSKSLSALADKQALDRLRMGYRSLLSDSLETEESSRKLLLIDELIKLKEHDRLYQIHEGFIQIKPLSSGSMDQVEVRFPLPARIAPGSYVLELITFQDGKGTLLQRETIEVHLSGFTELLHRLAKEKGLLYGVLAVIVATLSGLAIGIVFTSRGAH
jgi:uncharacterized protein (TIGR02186 family)